MSDRVAVVTGASAGIGAATATRLSDSGFQVVIGARRMDRLSDVATRCGAHPIRLDVCDDESVDAFTTELLERFGTVHLLINNAGGALGLDAVADADLDGWDWMYQANVLGTVRMCRRLLPALLASGDGQILNVGSIAGIEPYPGGAGYNAAKHTLRAVTQVMRMELVGQPIRIGEIDPGMVDTDFSSVRFGGDDDRARAVYDGLTPLTADDIAECLVWMATRPAHVNIDQLVVKPRAQATATMAHRST